MSRKQWKFSDFDKYMKPMHLAGKQVTLTVMHIGVETIKARKREFVIAGDAPEEQPDDLLLILHFREYPKPLRLNTLNRSKIRELIGDDPASLIGRKITLRPITLKQFGGQEAIDIVSVEKASAAIPRTVAPQPEEHPVTEITSSGPENPASEWREEIDDSEIIPAGTESDKPTQGPNATKLTASDFGKAVHELGIDAKTAQVVRMAYTIAGVTDWQGAINELKPKAKQPA